MPTYIILLLNLTLCYQTIYKLEKQLIAAPILSSMTPIQFPAHRCATYKLYKYTIVHRALQLNAKLVPLSLNGDA